MTHRIFVFVLVFAPVLIAAVQYDPNYIARSLLFLPRPHAWLVSRDVPDGYRFCAAQDPDGTVRGCVTAKDLRDRATKERQK